MSAVDIEGGEFSVDAALLAEGFGMDPELVLPALRERRITSLCERGVDEDAGRNRLSFFFGRQRLRLVIDEAGNVLDRRIDEKQLPTGRTKNGVNRI